MPKSETWPGEGGPDPMRASDSAGSYDSVLSGNSGLSSLEHLSAEEKACLMFLEETIESLDTEDDGRLSSEEPDPHPGNREKKLPDPPGAQNLASEDKMDVDRKPTKNIMVPTPLVLARGGRRPGSEEAAPTGKPACLPRSERDASESDRRKCSVVQREETAAPSKPGDGSSRTADGPLPRGPLSYDALVHLRRNASTKKTPLCPAVDHTIDLERRCPSLAEGPVLRKQQRSDKSHPGPPAVAPKPKKIPAHISLKTQTEESSSVQNAADPQVVRLEALQKLGLLKDQGQEGGAGGVLPAPDPAFRGSSGDSAGSPSVCPSQLPEGPKTEALQPEKAAAVEDVPNHHNHKNNAHRPKPPHKAAGAAPRTAPKPPDSVGYTVMVVPGMGAERKEALRKLGLLKN